MKNEITSIGEILFDIYGTQKNFGGAPFNFIFHAKKITGKANFVTAVGDYDNGETILEFLGQHDFSQEYIGVKKGLSTGTVMVKLNKLKVPEYHIKNNVAYDFIDLSENQKSDLIKSSGLVYFGTLCQRNEVSRKTINSFFNSDLIKFCDLNLRQAFYSEQIITDSLQAADILKLNIDEMKMICEIFNIDFTDSSTAATELMKRFEISNIAVTKGEDGAELYSNSEFDYYKSEVTNAVDTVGAGDAYSAVLAVGILNGLKINKINRLANQFASEICMVKGALPQNEDVYKIFREKLTNE